METTSAKTINIKATVENPTFTPVCMAGNRLFVRKKGEENSRSFNVLHTVSQSNLQYFRSQEGIHEHYKEIWQMAVAGDNTELGLSEYIEEETDFRDLDEDEEWFPDKEDYAAEVFNEWDDLRAICDGVILDDTDECVGTWEDEGWYAPNEDEIQIVFNTTE